MFVAEDVIRGGEALSSGLRFAALNLPNDKKIHEKHGFKIVFSATIMKKKFDSLNFPVAQQMLSSSDTKKINFNSRFLFILGHELAHGIGPSFVEKNGTQNSIEQLLKEKYLPTEECKADCLGFVFLFFLKDKKIISEEQMESAVLSQVSGFFSGRKTSFSGAHGIGDLIEYNWLKKDGAVIYDNGKELFSVDVEKSLISYKKLAFELMRLQKEGDYQQTKDFCEKWTTKPPEVLKTIDRLDDLLLDVYPIFKISQ